MNSKIRIAAIA